MVAAGTRFLYVSVGSEIVGFSINQSTGTLTSTSWSPFTYPSGRNPQGLAVSPSGQFLYAADAGGGIDAFQIDSSTGDLTSISGSPFGVGDVYSVAIDPSGSFAYASDTTHGNVLAFTIAPNGTLQQIAGSPFSLPSGTGSVPLSIAANGSFVYVTLNGPGEVAGFSVNSTTGGLTPVSGSPFVTGSQPTNIALSTNFLYVVNAKNGSVSGYSVNPSTGALASMPGSPFFQDIGTIVPDSSGKYLYLSSSLGIAESNINSQTGVPTLGSSTISNNGDLSMAVVQLPSSGVH